jgi:hypothetical protein
MTLFYIWRSDFRRRSIEDFQQDKLWIIRKGKIQKQAIDLAVKTRYAANSWWGSNTILSVSAQGEVSVSLLVR